MIVATNVPSRSVRLTVERGGHEVGHAWLYFIRSDLHSRPYGLLEDVWIDPHFQGNEHEMSLVRCVMRQAKDEGCYRLVVTSRTENEKVHELYKSLGFTIHGYEFQIDF